jgi:hypothetical protein
VTFQRTPFIVTGLDQEVPGRRRPAEAGIPILGYYRGQGGSASQEQRGQRHYQRLVIASQAALTNPGTLEDLVKQALDQRNPQISKPPRRIAAIPTSKVDGYRLGAAGPCPNSQPVLATGTE